jgi:hypothetical protein
MTIDSVRTRQSINGATAQPAAAGYAFSTSPLDVEPQDAIPGQTESADGRFVIDAGMRPVQVVLMQPGR